MITFNPHNLQEVGIITSFPQMRKLRLREKRQELGFQPRLFGLKARVIHHCERPLSEGRRLPVHLSNLLALL